MQPFHGVRVMSEKEESIFMIVLFTVTLLSGLVLGHKTTQGNMRAKAIENGAAYYDMTTAKFTWESDRESK